MRRPLDCLTAQAYNMDMNQLSREQRAMVIRCLCDGVSIRGTSRITGGVAKNTIQKLTRDLGREVLQFHDNVLLENLPCKRLELDEVWNFCYAKDKNLPDSMRGMPGVGSMWTWTALCADTKLIVSWQLGARDAANADAFIGDIASRLGRPVQITTAGNNTYLTPMEDHLVSERRKPGAAVVKCKVVGTRRVP